MEYSCFFRYERSNTMRSYPLMHKNVALKKPLVHCITNYVTINDCANALLACGASPIMADDPAECAEVTALCGALVLNTGMLHQNTLQSMLISGKLANERGIPVILDPVGVGVSAFRRESIAKIMSQIRLSVIRGNLSEIRTLCGENTDLRGVDAAFSQDPSGEDNAREKIELTKRLSRNTGAVVAVTGAFDVVSDERNAVLIRNGHPDMTKITGCGCMLSAVVGAFAAANRQNLLPATVAALAMFAISGEIGYEKVSEKGMGIGSFHAALIDELGFLSAPEYFESVLERRGIIIEQPR